MTDPLKLLALVTTDAELHVVQDSPDTLLVSLGLRSTETMNRVRIPVGEAVSMALAILAANQAEGARQVQAAASAPIAPWGHA